MTQFPLGHPASDHHSIFVENLWDYAIFALDVDGRIQTWNIGAQNLQGYQADEVIGRHFSLLYTMEDRARGYPDAELAAAAAMGRYEEEGWRLRNNGERFWANIVITAIRDADGNLVGFGKVTRDLSERREAEIERARMTARFKAFFDRAPTGLVVMGADGRLVEVNQAFCALLARTESTLAGQSLAALVVGDDAAIIWEHQSRLRAGCDDGLPIEVRLAHAQGHAVTVLIHTVALQDEKGDITALVSHVRDITYQRQFEEKLAYLADHDELTGLMNRRRFTAEVQAHVERCRRYGPTGAVLMLDLDNFKQVNDSLGHFAGDLLIQGVAAILRESLRSSDTIARIGGDEFAVLLPHGGYAEALAVGNKICDALRSSTHLHPGLPGRPVTGSVGVAVIEESGTADDILVSADLNVYEAKEAGRDTVAGPVAGGVERPARKRVVWASRIEAALASDRFELWLQPILNLTTNQVSNYELLLRMIGPDGDPILPGAFIEVAERSGLIVELDSWVVREAVAMLSRLPKGRHEDVVFSVNLSGLSVGHRRIQDLIEGELSASKVDPQRLCFEITETTAVQSLHVAQSFATRLRGLGCSMALDDFGSGFGSFYYLKHLPFDHVKIDGEFVAGCLRSSADRLVLQSLAAVAHGLGKLTVAEFVEDEATLQFLREEGVDYAQGFHIGKPAPLGVYLG